jgi:phosphotriesterase-related protein
MAFIRTVLGDVDAEELEITYSHEHVIIEQGYVTEKNDLFLLNDVDKVSQELAAFYAGGGRTMVDTMPAGAGRNVLKLAEVSRRTKVKLIVPTGLHLAVYYPANHWQFHYSEQQLADLFIDDIRLGVDAFDYSGPLVKRTPHQAGMVKLATEGGNFTAHQEKIFHAVVAAHLETGAPILTHSKGAGNALEQVAWFEKLGADLSHVVISHVDKEKDLGFHRELLQTGVRVEYDSAFRWGPGQENPTYELLRTFLPEFPGQITMGMDAAKHSYWKSYGGSPGLNFLLTRFKQDLEQMGLGQYYKHIFIHNPADLFSFR